MRRRRCAFPGTPLAEARSAVPAAASIWAAVRPWQAGGSVVTVTCCLMADMPNCTHDSTEARAVSCWPGAPGGTECGDDQSRRRE